MLTLIQAAVSWTATVGTITAGGLYTAPPEGRGSALVTAAVVGRVDTTRVFFTSSIPVASPAPIPDAVPASVLGRGLPFGQSGLLSAGVPRQAFTLSIDGVSTSNFISRLAAARAAGLTLLVNMTGGDHAQYLTGGVFDMAKWKARQDAYRTDAIQRRVADAVQDGTLFGSFVMDEPSNTALDNSWGPEGTMNKARVDSMCGYVKAMFPTLAVGVWQDHRKLEPEKNYAVCDFTVSQYRLSKAPVDEFREGGLAFARRSGIGILFSLNLLHGGTRGSACPKYGFDPTGKLCPMTPEQVRTFGLALAAGCGLVTWRYEREYFDNPAIQAAFREVADSLAKLPRTSCRRG